MLLLLGIGIGMRVHLSVAIVAMTDNTTSTNPDIPTYDWKNKSLIISSFYWGYFCLQVVTAELGRKYGPKKFLLLAMFINSTAISLIPLIANLYGSIGVIVCRVIMGLTQGCFYCNVHNILSKWTPDSERTRLTSFALSGASLGTIFTMPIVGYMSSSNLGWPSAHYLYGIVGFSWTISYLIIGSDSPREHRSITEAELKYIEGSMKPAEKKLPTPWKSIATSVPVWALFFTQIGGNWAYTTLLSEIPIYMSKVMGFDMQNNGLLSAVPYLTNFFLTYVFSFSSDFLINKNILSITLCRKIANSIATTVPALSLIVLGFLPNDSNTLSVILLIVAVGAQSASSSGYLVNHLDLSPNFAGILMAICNSTAYFVGIFAPILVQLVVVDESDKAEWRTIFIVAALLSLIPNIIFIVRGSGEVQPWNSIEGEESRQQERIKKMSVISIMST
nr:putative inorganic phosphate cotransporter [Leptinotarsa decemlineata]